MGIKEVKASKILNPTSIDLGEYVINPYRGCIFSCLYCYVRFNKVTWSDMRCWGEYVDVRINAPGLLEKELSTKRPRRVLLGSTTECFQPVEARYRITRRVLEILNRHKTYYSILTRSPLLLEYIPLLKEGYCEHIYFTINRYDDALKDLLEPKGPSFQARMSAVDKLLEEGLPVIAYFSPVLPYISDVKDIFFRFAKTDRVEFEGLNFNLGNINDVIEAIGSVCPQLKPVYAKMAKDVQAYNNIWQAVRQDIVREAIKARKNHSVYIHPLNAYFQNTYRKTDARV